MKQSEQLKKQTRKFWDANPCGLSDSWEHSKRVRYSYTDAYLLDYLNKEWFGDKQVLEVGCGQGIDASEIIRFCKTYIGVDLSNQSLKIARKECEQRNDINANHLFSAQDSELLGIKTGAFDIVYSIGVLHHTENFKDSINEIHRVLKKDGVLIMMLYRSYTPLWLVVRAIRGMLGVPLIGPKLKQILLDSLRDTKSEETDSLSGTALIELVGSPIINTFTINDVKNSFGDSFSVVNFRCFRTGIDQVVRIMPSFLQRNWPQERLSTFEERFNRWLGFYMVVNAVKQ